MARIMTWPTVAIWILISQTVQADTPDKTEATRDTAGIPEPAVLPHQAILQDPAIVPETSAQEPTLDTESDTAPNSESALVPNAGMEVESGTPQLSLSSDPKTQMDNAPEAVSGAQPESILESDPTTQAELSAVSDQPNFTEQPEINIETVIESPSESIPQPEAVPTFQPTESNPELGTNAQDQPILQPQATQRPEPKPQPGQTLRPERNPRPESELNLQVQPVPPTDHNLESGASPNSKPEPILAPTTSQHIENHLVPAPDTHVAANPAEEQPANSPIAGSCGRSYVPLMNPKKANRLHRIVGGDTANAHSIPFVVGLRKGGKHFCSGSLIRVNEKDETDIVLTAAHCVIREKKRPAFTVLAGSHFLLHRVVGEMEVPVIKVVQHKHFDKPKKTANDIALLKLAWPIKFNQTIQPVCLPGHGKKIKDNVNGFVAGWGSIKEKGPLSNALLQVTLQTISYRQCRKKFGRELINGAMLCVGYPRGGRDACQGDSGGPFFVETSSGYTLHGMVSFGVGCAYRNVPGVYTRISSYVKWINQEARRLSAVKV